MFDTLSPDAANWIFAVWMLILGGAVGSFLNVVVYRLPAGLSIVAPPSHCPRCKHPIRWRDNVPVLGWILLRGRCRDCGQPIAARYPLVEAVTAAVFLALALAAGFGGGANLPPRGAHVAADEFVWAGRSMGLRCEIALYHAFLLATLLAAALTDYDARRSATKPLRGGVIAKLFLPALIVGLAAPLILGETLRPVAGGWSFEPAVTDGLLGLGVGLLLAATASMAVGFKQGAMQAVSRHALEIVAMATVGLFLGWQAACGIALLAAAGSALTALSRTFPPTGWIALSCLAWILLWANIAAIW